MGGMAKSLCRLSVCRMNAGTQKTTELEVGRGLCLFTPLLYYGEGPLIAYLYSAVNVAYKVWVRCTFFRMRNRVG
jgi:hypothetical protein